MLLNKMAIPGAMASDARSCPELFNRCEMQCAGAGNHLPNDVKMPIEVQPPFGSAAEIAAVVEAVHQEQTMAKWQIEDFPSLGVPVSHDARREISLGFAGWKVGHLKSRRTQVMT